MRPKFVDFHCHLDLYPSLAEAIAKCEAQEVATLAVTTTPKAFKRNQELTAKSKFVRVALGLHPQLVEERFGELDLFQQLLPETRYVGEVGLDASPRHYRSMEMQSHVFRTVLRLCAQAGDKVLSVHSVRAARQVLDLVEQNLPTDRGIVVMHWFSGSVRDVLRAVELGCYFSVNEKMLDAPNGQRILQAIPDDRLLTETDGPFIEKGGTNIQPGSVQFVVSEIAKLKGVPPEKIRRLVIENLKKLTTARRKIADPEN